MDNDITLNANEAAADFKELAPIGNTPVAPAHGIAAIALNMAMKYHDMQMIPDGLTYQQYKMEGRNIRTIGIVDVFETAEKIEVWLLASSERIANVVIDAVSDGLLADDATGEPLQQDGERTDDAPNSEVA